MEIRQVFEENYEWFKRFLRGRFIDLNDYDIEDLIQKAALKLLYKGENIAGIRNITSYVFTMLENGAKDFFRKRKKEELAPDIEGIRELLEEKILARELAQVIMRSIERLDPKQRYVFVETELKGRSYDELTEETGEKLGTLLSRKSRAKEKLKRMLYDYFK